MADQYDEIKNVIMRAARSSAEVQRVAPQGRGALARVHLDQTLAAIAEERAACINDVQTVPVGDADDPGLDLISRFHMNEICLGEYSRLLTEHILAMIVARITARAAKQNAAIAALIQEAEG